MNSTRACTRGPLSRLTARCAAGGWPSGIRRKPRKGYFNLFQDVSLLGENIVPTAGRFFADVLHRRGLTAADVDWLLPHISSMFFQQPLYEQMARIGFDFPVAKWFTNLRYKGNTGAASIFIMLEELYRSGKLRPGHRILCASRKASLHVRLHVPDRAVRRVITSNVRCVGTKASGQRQLPRLARARGSTRRLIPAAPSNVRHGKKLCPCWSASMIPHAIVTADGSHVLFSLP